MVWVATRSGLARVQGEEVEVFDRRHGLPSNVIRNLHVWRSPSGTDVLWIATESGVARTIPGASPWQIASLLGADALGVFGVLVEPDGRGGERLWVAASHGGLGLYEGRRWRSFRTAGEGLPLTGLRLLERVADSDGRAALGVGSGGGELFRILDGPRFERAVTPWPKYPGEAVMDLLARRVDGRYERWTATRASGVYRWRDGAWTAFRPAGAVGQWTTIRLLEQVDRDGRSWLWASSNQGLARFDGAEWTLLGGEAGLPDGGLLGLSLVPDRDRRPVLWAGSHRAGIVRIDVSNPLAPRLLDPRELPEAIDPTPYSALHDATGRVYLCTNDGVQLLESDPTGGYRHRRFGRRDGMVHEECNTDAQAIDAHGRFWTGTLDGLAVYDPASAAPDRVPKPLRLTHARLDGREVDPAALEVPPGAHELRIDFALLAWQREGESRFRTQLIGHEPEPGAWVEESYRLFGALAPGRYRLRVEGRDYAGLASEPLEVAIEVLPAWWQRLRFRVALLLVFAFAGPLFYLYRVRRLSRQKRELEQLVAARTAELATANERLAELSRHDPLTGVANRRRLDEALDEEWRRAARTGAPLTFLLLDVDHFEAYNDDLDHPAGDVCLRAVAQELDHAHTRAGELVARYGGEELGVLIPGFAPDAALAWAESVRERVADLAIPHPRSAAGPVVTVSIGVAAARAADGGSALDLVSAADRALYRARSEGRNCVRAAPEPARKHRGGGPATTPIAAGGFSFGGSRPARDRLRARPAADVSASPGRRGRPEPTPAAAARSAGEWPPLR